MKFKTIIFLVFLLFSSDNIACVKLEINQSKQAIIINFNPYRIVILPVHKNRITKNSFILPEVFVHKFKIGKNKKHQQF